MGSASEAFLCGMLPLRCPDVPDLLVVKPTTGAIPAWLNGCSAFPARGQQGSHIAKGWVGRRLVGVRQQRIILKEWPILVE